ncbi:serine/threonine protein kinase [Actinomadura barringtoniae]|uniref:Serine/threonine protein kinase n=1 Tax=Actinomadura barringtoniae TaxID=1427535 RepID=A0A939PES0_9ACTN|nr:serine/threonine-protein kinase [Actinomadura barringtoniae]MBO2448364.1 serine/threonine protein kinase [Actinomadura barringtoniae]
MLVGALRSGDPERLGTYALIGRVGEGGQGTVFLGTGEDGRRVAIKLLHSELTSDDKARARFLRELDVAKRVAPFCTAQVIDADADGDRPYIVSEYVPGPSLHQLVGEQGPLRGAALERLAVGTATALSAIHQAEIIHRDFKPHNVLIGNDGPRVIDFGVARAISGSTTLTSKVIGTPSYMAPEQIQGEEIGTAADVFCWAATLVYAATGSSPFGQDSIPAVINRILNQQPKLGDDLDGPLRELVLDCLSKDPAARPKARQVLMRLLGHEETGPTPAVVTDPAAHDEEAATAMLAVGSVLAAELGDEDDLATPGVAAASGAAAGGAAGAGLGAAAAQGLNDSAGTDPYEVVSDAAHYDAGGHDVYAPGGHAEAGYDAGGSASSETQVVRALPDEVAHDDPYSEEEARNLPTPAEWLENNTLPGGGGKRPGSPRGRQRRVAALAGAAALLIAAGIASAAFALSGDGGAQPSTRVGDPSNTAPAQTTADPTTEDVPTYPTRAPRHTESATPTPSDTASQSPSESPTPTPSHTPTPTPSDSPTKPPTSPPDTSPPPTKTPPPTDPPTKPTGGDTGKTTG